MKIKFLENSDVHGYISAKNYSGGHNLPIGAAKIASKLQQIRAESKDPVVLIENGDFIQGSPLSLYIAKKYSSATDLIKVVNQMDFDLHVLGNHEFNYGLNYLKRTIAGYKAPVLAANILNRKQQPYFGNAYTVIEKAGIKIAVLGLVTQYIPHWEKTENIAGMQFVSAVKTAKKYIPYLKKQADIVVVSYHGGFEKDLKTGEPTELLTGENEGFALLHEVSGIDALFTGHQHREIAEIVNGVPVVQPGYRGTHIAEIELTIEEEDQKFRISKKQTKLHTLSEVKEDLKTLQLTSALESNLEKWLDQRLATVQGDMTITDSMAARITEHPYIEFINHVQMSVSGASISATALFDNEGKGFKERITMRDILTNYIYPNTLAVVKITGETLKKALEQTASYLAIKDHKAIFNPIFIAPKPQYYNYDCMKGYSIQLT